MKTLKIFFGVLTLFTLMTSCSDDFNLDYEITEGSELKAAPGEEYRIDMIFESEFGVKQVILKSELLGLDYLENFETNANTVSTSVVVIIPSDAEKGDVFDIRVEFSDKNNNSVVDNFSVTVS